MKIGILGGTFNPIHNGHLLMAEEVRLTFNLDRVYFIPVSIPPHKGYKPLISDSDRLRLIELAIEFNPYFYVSDIEIKRGGISYTIDTVKSFYSSLVIEDKIYLLIGADLIKDITTWMSYKELIEKVNLVVISRTSFKAESYKKDFSYIIPFNSTGFNVSSSLIRQRLLEGYSIKYLVPYKVEDYINSKGLYRVCD